MVNDIIKILDSMILNYNNIESEYYFENHKVPRVTRILQRCIHNDGLMYWANSLGFKHQSYKKILENAAMIGTQCHDNIDRFTVDNSHIIHQGIMPEAKFAYESFNKWYNDISSYAKVEVILHEHPLVCKYFGGTLDALYKLDDKLFLVDYKTSNHVTYNYCLQLSAYKYMLKELMNIDIDGCIILQLSKNNIAYNEFLLNFNNQVDKNYMDLCTDAFMSMVLYYYHLNMVENKFNDIGWEVN